MITLHKNIIQSVKFCPRVRSTLNIHPRSQCILSSMKTKGSSPAGAVRKPPPPPLQKGRFAATRLLATMTSAKHKYSQTNGRVGVKHGGSSRQHQWELPSLLKGWGGSVTYWILNSRNLRSEEFYFLSTSGSLKTEDPSATLISDGWICAIHRKGCALWDRKEVPYVLLAWFSNRDQQCSKFLQRSENPSLPSRQDFLGRARLRAEGAVKAFNKGWELQTPSVFISQIPWGFLTAAVSELDEK